MSNFDYEKAEAEMEKIEEKIRDLNRKKRNLRRKIEDAENEEFLEVIRELDLSPEELSDFLKEFMSKDKAPHKNTEDREEATKVQAVGKEKHYEK